MWPIDNRNNIQVYNDDDVLFEKKIFSVNIYHTTVLYNNKYVIR